MVTSGLLDGMFLRLVAYWLHLGNDLVSEGFAVVYS